MPIDADKVSDLLPSKALRHFILLRQTYGKQINALKEFCRLHRPRMAILGDDGVGTDPCVTSVLRHEDVPLVCVPYGYGGVEDLEHVLDLRHGTEYRNIDTEGGPVVAAHYPHWVKSGRHAGALLFRPELILARESLGITLRRPWRTYGSEADLFCVSGQQYADHLRQEGVPDNLITVTGSLAGVQIHNILQTDSNARKAFRQPVKLQSDHTRILVSWPPSYHQTHGDRSEFPDSYASLTHAVVQPLIDHPNVRLTVTLHPSTLPGDRAVFADLNIPLSTDSIIDLIPKHDIFLTATSSTTRWAIACGKPVINYDLYKFGITAFHNLPGVIHVETHQAYTATLHKLLDGENFFATTSAAQISVADDWALVDDRFLEKLLAASCRATSV